MKAQLTLKDWLAKYYPVPANSKEAKRDPIGHSLRKWRGLRENVLDRYGLERSAYGTIREGLFGKSFDIDDVTCALCVKHKTIALTTTRQRGDSPLALPARCH